jgi:hypothetical protein
MWHRGTSKARWIARLKREFANLHGVEGEVLHMSPAAWFFKPVLPAILLLVVPCILGFIVRFVRGNAIFET